LGTIQKEIVGKLQPAAAFNFYLIGIEEISLSQDVSSVSVGLGVFIDFLKILL
jgi:hypothetical protein